MNDAEIQIATIRMTIWIAKVEIESIVEESGIAGVSSYFFERKHVITRMIGKMEQRIKELEKV